MIVCKLKENGARSLHIDGNALEILKDLTVILKGIGKHHNELSEKVECKAFPEVVKALAEIALRGEATEEDIAYAILNTELSEEELQEAQS